jgi:ESCO1/2 acetyl-transferase/zinc-finger of acetyl-transferase ESCO
MDKFVVSLPRGSSILKRKTPSGASAEQKGLKRAPAQMFLDLGQKSFGASKHCSACGMFYVVGDEEDEKRHLAFCTKAKAGPMLPTTKGLPVLATFNDEHDVIVEVKPGKHKRPQHLQDSINAVLELVQTELGSEAHFVGDEEETSLLYLRDKRVLAALVVHAIQPSKLVALSASVTSTDVRISSPGAVVDKMTQAEAEAAQSNPMPATPSRPPTTTLGVKLMWTGAGSRRAGLAGRLVDAARKSFEFGRIVRREHVCFSQPTSEGLAFGLSYCRSPSIWAYK